MWIKTKDKSWNSWQYTYGPLRIRRYSDGDYCMTGDVGLFGVRIYSPSLKGLQGLGVKLLELLDAEG